MNKRDSDCKFEALPDGELRKRLAFEDWRNEANHIKDEVAFRLFRLARESGDKQRIGILSEALSRRILSRAYGFVTKSGIFPGKIKNLDEAACELAQFLWIKLISNNNDAAHAERAFGQLFKRRGIDFQRKLYAQKRNLQSSVDALDQNDMLEELEGNGDFVTGPDDILVQKQQFQRLRSVMHAVLNREELVTVELLFDFNMPVKEVAKALDKTPRSIFNYKTQALAKLKEELSK